MKLLSWPPGVPVRYSEICHCGQHRWEPPAPVTLALLPRLLWGYPLPGLLCLWLRMVRKPEQGLFSLLHGFPLASLDWAALWFEALSTPSSILPSSFPRCHHLKPLPATSCLPFLYPELASPPIHLMTVSIYLGFGFLYGLNQYTNQQHSLVAEATLNGLSCHLQPKESYYRRGI